MSQCFPKAREKFLGGDLNWADPDDDYRAIFLPQSYTPDFSAEFLADIPESVRIATSELIENRTKALGVAGSDPIKFQALLSPTRAAQALIFRDTGSEETSDLIFFMSMDGLVGVPLALEGLDYFIYPDAVEGGYFRL